MAVDPRKPWRIENTNSNAVRQIAAVACLQAAAETVRMICVRVSGTFRKMSHERKGKGTRNQRNILLQLFLS